MNGGSLLVSSPDCYFCLLLILFLSNSTKISTNTMTTMLSCDREWGVAWRFLVQWSSGGREGVVYQIYPSLQSYLILL